MVCLIDRASLGYELTPVKVTNKNGKGFDQPFDPDYA